MNHRHLFEPIETPPTDGWASFESTEKDGAKAAAARAARDDVAGFVALWTDHRFNEYENREVMHG